MTSVLTRIDANVDSRCLTASMNKQGCAVYTEDAPKPYLVIDLDHPNVPVRPSARKCDCLFLAEDSNRRRLLVVPLELKGTGLTGASALWRAGP